MFVSSVWTVEEVSLPVRNRDSRGILTSLVLTDPLESTHVIPSRSAVEPVSRVKETSHVRQ